MTDPPKSFTDFAKLAEKVTNTFGPEKQLDPTLIAYAGMLQAVAGECMIRALSADSEPENLADGTQTLRKSMAVLELLRSNIVTTMEVTERLIESLEKLEGP